MLVTAACGCDTSPAGPDDQPPPGDDDPDPFNASIFSNNVWHDGGGYAPDGVDPEWVVPARGADEPVDITILNSNPALGSVVPLDVDDIRYVAQATNVLTSLHLEQITNAFFEAGRVNSVGDVVIFPSLVGSMVAGETHRFFHFNVQAPIEEVPQRGGAPEPRTRVVGIAFGNGTGGYVAIPPNTGDTFAGALVWMKATRNPHTAHWSMQQRDWRTGTERPYGTSLRLLIRGDAVVALIRQGELDAIGATMYRWDTYSYTTDASTDWSHDFTGWLPIS
jgi:hypothetical protein